MRKWEYKMVSEFLGTNDLNLLGQDGWELCGIIGGTLLQGSLYFFKRELAKKPKKPKKQDETIK